MKNRRRLLTGFAAAGVLGSAGLCGVIREALANGDKPVTSGLHKITGTVTVNGKPAQPGMALGTGELGAAAAL